ncbi:MAG: carboxymuconolactone decarboxylase family protein [Planctomycetota bacterium]|jgi:alkylhydroperoxidase family enzyme
MAWIDLVPVDSATGAIKASYDAAIARAGRVFHIVRTMSPNPPILDASMALYKKLMKGPSGLPRKERELLAVVTSAVNDCYY